eukprot:4257508-Amphidinium_carterae.1
MKWSRAVVGAKSLLLSCDVPWEDGYVRYIICQQQWATVYSGPVTDFGDMMSSSKHRWCFGDHKTMIRNQGLLPNPHPQSSQSIEQQIIMIQ